MMARPGTPAPPLYRGWRVEYHGAHLASGLAGLARVMPPPPGDGADGDGDAGEAEIQLRVDVGRQAVVVGRACGLEEPVELSVAERQALREHPGHAAVQGRLNAYYARQAQRR